VAVGFAVAAGLALALPAALAQAVETPQPGIFHAGTPVAAPAGPAAAGPQTAKLLYNQNSDNSGNNFASINWGKGNTHDTQAADDFTVPKGQTWTIAQVAVTGAYFSSTPATSENVFFYKNTVNAKKQDVPGVQVKKLTLKGKGSGGSLVITGIKGVALATGHYWLSVQANIPSGQAWYWDTRTVLGGAPAVFRNPGNAWDTGCTAWTPWYICANISPSYGPDLMFALYGSKS
jgi:hypothetical protein